MNVKKDQGRGHQSVVMKISLLMKKGVRQEESQGSEDICYMLIHEDIRMFKTVNL